MPRVTAKICGLSTADTVGAAIRHGASHLGFVFFARSPRNISAEQAASLKDSATQLGAALNDPALKASLATFAETVARGP